MHTGDAPAGKSLVSGRCRPAGERLEVVGGGCHRELLGGSGKAPQLECSQLQVAFEVPEHALDALSSLSRASVAFGSGERAEVVSQSEFNR